MRKLHMWGMIVILIVVLGALPTPAPAQETNALPLAERGPYGVGMLDFSYVDDSRDGRELTGFIWYPADAGKSSYLMPEYQAKPDTTAAPYPLIMYSHGLDGDANSHLGLVPHLASYGFVVVSISHNDPSGLWINHVNRPMDILFVLNQLATTGTEGTLAGVYNTEHVGITGFSYGGFTTILMSGAQIDPASLQAYCTDENHQKEAYCSEYTNGWEETAAYRAQFDPPLVEGELWPAYTDPRIAALMPFAPCDGPTFGEQGLSNPTPPILIVGLKDDEMRVGHKYPP